MITAVDNCLIIGRTMLSFNGRTERVQFPTENGYCKTIDLIGTGAMMHNQKLRELIIPEGISEIGDRAFKGCGRLHSVILPQSIQFISHTAFEETESLEFASFYSTISDEKLREIVENAIRLTNGKYVLDPMMLDSYSKETVHILMPDAFCEVFPLGKEMGCFFADEKYRIEPDIFVMTNPLHVHGKTGENLLCSEDDAIHMKIVSEEANWFGDDESECEEKLKLPLLFLSETVPQNENTYKVRFELRKRLFFTHKVYKGAMDGKPYYIVFRVYFQNKSPAYSLYKPSMSIFSEEGRLSVRNRHYGEIMRKFEFIADYL